jgi:hypothetical protein
MDGASGPGSPISIPAQYALTPLDHTLPILGNVRQQVRAKVFLTVGSAAGPMQAVLPALFIYGTLKFGKQDGDGWWCG